ncbi:unnamed protein product [Cladocopium goreaui]|uniref:Sodium/potassium/calcium exchanger 2 (Na(+)/K(+)/Ca(2+)-exchange protein 2) (Retinal cone Na-Ca+K exchanger) (Solute carrier family 24 member 2) n=1 Tax=Cladocopium goreaui TaxID=2562237 RepID=A0A9P1FJ45_9DINO|nr:unnamed protein product [Cladocopium goreaui]
MSASTSSGCGGYELPRQFFLGAEVCDIYFVSSIEVFSKRFKIPDDVSLARLSHVAGATLMALGCNGPELALNTIAIFQPSNIGVGAVIGGEVFNVLVIIGTALLATPEEYMPLHVGQYSFWRDVIFYVISVMLLYHALHDGRIDGWNVMWLLSGAVVYTLTVVYSGRFRKFFRRKHREYAQHKRMRSSQSESGVYSLMSECSDSPVPVPCRMSPMLNPKTNEPDPRKVLYWNKATHSADPFCGTVLQIRVEMRNRLMDRAARFDARYVVLLDSALVVSALVDPRTTEQCWSGWKTFGQDLSRCASGMVYEKDQKADAETGWHHGGLDIIWMDRPVDRKRGQMANKHSITCGQKLGFNLHVHMHNSELAQLIPVATLEFIASTEDIVESWAEALKDGLLRHRSQAALGPPQTTAKSVLLAWMEWFQFPIKSFTALTIPDVSMEDAEHLYPWAFVMSMAWLALFAYLVVAACNGIHKDFRISTSVLGYTVAAAGTSFPNVFSGMCVARQGKTTMAVANALGANVQNVFLALAIPWAIQCTINRGSFELPFTGLLSAVVEIYVTLLPVVVVFTLSNHQFPRWSGYMFLVIYACYLAVALTQDTFHCPSWPFFCSATPQ